MSTAPATNGTPRTVKDAARWYIDRGFSPIPLPSRSKRPVLQDWTTITITGDDVETLFAPDGNIGIRVGALSRGCVVVDLDCIQARRAAPILLTDTQMLSGRSSAPDSHRWYATDDPPNKAAEQFDDPTVTGHGRRMLELLSTGKQAVVPPSIYPAEPEKGHPQPERSVWHKHGEPAKVSIYDLRSSVQALAAATLFARHWPRGARNDAALALAGGLLRAGLTVQRVETFLRAVAVAAEDEQVEARVAVVIGTAEKLTSNEPTMGWPKLAHFLGANGETLVRTAREWLDIKDRPHPRIVGVTSGGTQSANAWEEPVPLPEMPDVPTFPIHLFPPALADYWQSQAAALHVPVDYIAGPGLAVLGAAIGRSRAAEVKPGYAESPLLWITNIAPPGSAKSASLTASRAPLDKEESRWRKEHSDSLQTFDVEMARYEQNVKEWKKDPDASEPPTKPTRPTLRQAVLDDTTAEAAARVLRDCPRGVVLVKDELIGFGRMLNQYKSGGKGADKTFWLSGWNGRGVGKANRSKSHEDGPLVICDPFTAVAGMMCPDCLPELREEHQRGGPVQDGWVDRFLFQYPNPPDAVEESWATVPEEMTAAYSQIVLDLLGLEMVPMEDPGRETVYRPYYVRFDEGAKRAWSVFTRAIAERINSLPKTDSYRGVFSKLKHYGLRFACLFHCLDLVSDASTHKSAVTSDQMERAAAMVWYFEAHGRRCLGVGDRATEPARRLLDRLREWDGDQFSKRELHRCVRGQSTFRQADRLNAPLVLLTQHGFIAPTDPQAMPGRPSDRYQINPRWDRNSPGDMANMDKTPESPSSPGECGPMPRHGQNPPDMDKTPTPPPATRAEDPGAKGFGHVSGVLSMPGQDAEKSTNPSGSGGFVHIVHTTPEGGTRTDPPSGYTLVTDAAGLNTVVAALSDTGTVGVDTETTGLDPLRDRVRLIQLATGHGTFILDMFALAGVDLTDVFEALSKVEIIGHNLQFDLRFLARLGFTPGRVYDTMLASRVLSAGERTDDNAPKRHGLEDVVARELNQVLDKSHQKTDWSKPLTPEMIRYAVADAEVLLPLAESLRGKLAQAHLTGTANREMVALPGVAWASPIHVDSVAWTALASKAESECIRLREAMDGAAPNGDCLPGAESRNWKSTAEVKAAFAGVGINLKDTEDATLASVDHPLAELLREFRGASKLVDTYGAKWIKKFIRNGCVLPSWNQLGAESGRMSCSDPNLQQIPRGSDYRKCFSAAPGSNVLIKADYSQIELRIAAKIADEREMIAAYQDGRDLHALTAARILNKPFAEVTKADRQLAKAINFGLLFGMSAKTLRVYARTNYSVTLGESEAVAYRDGFFAAYPGLIRWHRQVERDVKAAGRTRGGTYTAWTLGKRRRILPAVKTNSKTGKQYPNLNEALNCPVQGSGADGLKTAIALLWNRRAECPHAVPVIFCHDEIVVECPEQHADAASAWLRRAMVDGMADLIAPVPASVEVSIGRTWAS